MTPNQFMPSSSKVAITLIALGFFSICNSSLANLVTLNGLNNTVVIGEFDGAIGSFFDGGYYIDVVDGVEIYGLAVSNETSRVALTNRPGWNPVVIDKASWDGGFAISTSATTLDIGSYETLFGTLSTQANLYYNFAGTNITNLDDQDQILPGVWPGTDSIEFGWSNQGIFSNFVAFSSSGTIIDKSLLAVQAIPEPSSVILVGLGVLCVVSFGKRSNLRK